MATQLLEIDVELEKEYNEFIQTEEGKRWKMNSCAGGDFSNYLYDFYPEYLQ